MNDQDSASVVITFLLLLPWLGRAAVSTMTVMASTHGVPKPRKRLPCLQKAEEAHDL
jgi:hypothetical protein